MKSERYFNVRKTSVFTLLSLCQFCLLHSHYVSDEMFSLFGKRIVAPYLRSKWMKRQFAKKKSDWSSPLLEERLRFISKLLEIPSLVETKKLLDKTKSLSLKSEDVANSFNYLISIGAELDDIRNETGVLERKECDLRARHEILSECGFTKVTTFDLNRYSKIVGLTEQSLKNCGKISHHIDVQDRLSKILNVNLNRCNDTESLRAIRKHLLQSFFADNYSMTAAEFKRGIRLTNPAVTQHSFKNLTEISNLLLNRFQFSKNQIKGTLFRCFGFDFHNIRQLMKLEPIDGIQISNILHSHTDVMRSTYDNVQKTIGYIKEFGIPESAIRHFPYVLLLDHQTVHHRLSELFKTEELQHLLDDPRVLRLISYQPQALSRLDYMKLLDSDGYYYHNCTLAHYSGSLKHFKRFIFHYDGKSKRIENVRFLVKTFNKRDSIQELLKSISRHPHWGYISIFDMKQTIDDLIMAGFELDDIYSHIQVVLYSSSVIFRQLRDLNQRGRSTNIRKTLPKRVQLKMVMYLIELEFNFSGDGVFLEKKRLYPMES